MTTLATMKARIAGEFRRDDLEIDIANAIATAIDAYKYETFPFNRGAFVDAPASDSETDNAWMTTAERLIRSRAMLEIAVNVIRYTGDDPFLANMKAEIADALTQLRLSQTQSTPAVPGTLGAMKTRIANEINRGDLLPEIGYAIRDAISYWAAERYFFNETRDKTFDTATDKDTYDVNDFNDILNVTTIDYVMCLAAGYNYTLRECAPLAIEQAIPNSGMSVGIPCEYSFYNQKLRFYPIPADTYQIRIGYHRNIPAPANDAEAANPWMTVAESLIRTQAKSELFKHVEAIADDEKAAKYATLASDYADILTRRTTKITASEGRVLPYC